MTVIEVIKVDSCSIPQYESTEVGINNDRTYRVKHTFIDADGKKILVEYPRVKITIDPTIGVFEKYPSVFPFKDCIALTDSETNSELLTLKIEDEG